jgi:hypothetical protein
VNTLQVLTNFEIGRRIVEHEQKGEKRAGYGQELLKELSGRLTEEFGNGFSERNLRSFRSLFLTYRERIPQIWQQPTAKLGAGQIVQQTTEKSLLSRVIGAALYLVFNEKVVTVVHWLPLIPPSLAPAAALLAPAAGSAPRNRWGVGYSRTPDGSSRLLAVVQRAQHGELHSL